ncbi:hypothetical protein D9M70_610940 [compost metagenome]
MHQKDGRKRGAQPLDQAIGPPLAAAGNGKQAGRLVDHQNLVIGVDHARLFGRRLIDKAHFQTSRSASPANISAAMRLTMPSRLPIAWPAKPPIRP